MTRHFVNALESLGKDVLAMGGRVEEALSNALRALLDRDVDLATRVVDGDRDINLHELRVDEECLKLLALYQPTARDLRFVTGVMKITNDLERVADLAVNIAERAVELAGMSPRDIPPAVLEMSEKSRAMVTAALDALVRSDTARAREVLSMDDRLDALLRNLFRELEEDMRGHQERIPADLAILSAGKNLERISDHACNIAEDVVYMVEGAVLRHMH